MLNSGNGELKVSLTDPFPSTPFTYSLTFNGAPYIHTFSFSIEVLWNCGSGLDFEDLLDTYYFDATGVVGETSTLITS